MATITKVFLLQLSLLWLLSLFGTGLGVYFELGLPDLIATKRTKDGDVTIKGYKALTNEALLASNSSEIAPQLLWATVGDPRIVKSTPTDAVIGSGGGNVSMKVFHYTDSGFYMMMELKTAEDSELLAKRAALKYGLPIKRSQIRHLLLSKLTCVLDLRDTERRSVRIVGRPSSLKNFPLKVEFLSPPGSESRSLFEKRLADDPDMSVPCSICLSSVSDDTPPDQTGDGNATNITESSVLPVPDAGANGGVTDDCRRRQPSKETVAAELVSLAANLSGLACDVARLDERQPPLAAALVRARAACARLSPPPPPPEALLKNLTTTLLAEMSARLQPELSLRHRLALRAVYNLRGGRTHNLIDSRRLRAKVTSGGADVLGPDGARFRLAGGGSGTLQVDDVDEELADLLQDSGWTFFAKLKLDASRREKPQQPVLTFWDPGSRRRWQLLVGNDRLSSAIRSGAGGGTVLASSAVLRPGVWHRVGASSGPATTGVVHSIDGSVVTSAATGDAAPTMDLPADRRRLWVGMAPGDTSGGFNGIVGCFGAAAAALTPRELEVVFATYCGGD